MASGSMKEIKLRIKSMESTRQITKAMQMVAASKLRRAQERAVESRPYFGILFSTIGNIIARDGYISTPYTEQRETNKLCYVVIAGDRGLAGGYNSNILKRVYAQMQEEKAPCTVVPIGKKALEFFRSRGVEVLTDAHSVAANVSIGDCFSLARELTERYLAGEFDGMYIGWTDFVSALSQSPASYRLLPLSGSAADDGMGSAQSEPVYEPSEEEVFARIVPEYIGGVIYGALCESVASELAARRNAMDAATKNADDMISSLSLSYNRARQGAITQEITEIVAGAEV